MVSVSSAGRPISVAELATYQLLEFIMAMNRITTLKLISPKFSIIHNIGWLS